MMTMVMVDIESDGPIPGDFSMISFGAVVVTRDPSAAPTFYGRLRPISEQWDPQALAVSGHSREETLAFDDPKEVMERFDQFLAVHAKGGARFISDNNGFDFMFIAWYFWHFLKKNPFGHSSVNLNSLYKGSVKSMFENCKHLRRTRHSHHPVDDARGNVEALLAFGADIKGALPRK